MKQLIVLVATIVLGIVIAAMILGFKSDASAINRSVTSQLNSVVQLYNASSSALH